MHLLQNQFAIVGGDLRIVKLAEMLAKENHLLYTYALEEAETLFTLPQVKKCLSIKEACEHVHTVIGPIPLTKDSAQLYTPFSNQKITLEEIGPYLKGKKFFCGNISEEFYKIAKEKQIKIIDLLQCEELVVYNTIATAEGAIQIAMEETQKTIHASKILLLGFGRVGKALAYRLKAMGAELFVAARKKEDFAWMDVYGYHPVNLGDLEKQLGEFSIIINTIPTLILKEKELKCIQKDCFLLDLASKPGGIDQKIAHQLGLKTIWALALPGKVAPVTSAKYIKNTIEHLLKEKQE